MRTICPVPQVEDFPYHTHECNRCEVFREQLVFKHAMLKSAHFPINYNTLCFQQNNTKKSMQFFPVFVRKFNKFLVLAVNFSKVTRGQYTEVTNVLVLRKQSMDTPSYSIGL